MEIGGQTMCILSPEPLHYVRRLHTTWVRQVNFEPQMRSWIVAYLVALSAVLEKINVVQENGCS